MLNTDELGRLARDHGVTSVPTVKVNRQGQVVDTLHGAESEASLRSFISKHATREADTKYTAAIQAYQRGDINRAITQAAEAALAEPDNWRLALDLAKLLMLEQRYVQTDELLKSLPAAIREQPEIRNLHVHVNFVRVAQEAPPAEALEKLINDNPHDLGARYRLSALKIMRNDYAGAMEQLLEVVRCDNAFREQAGRQGLRALFALLGENDPRVLRFREQLRLALH